MNSHTKSRGDARERILSAAETLIARHGVDGVSIRSINTAAGVSPGVLHYHFGSLDNLVEALLQRHMVPLMKTRIEMLNALHAQPVVHIRELVAVLVLPLAEKIIEEQAAGVRYARLLIRLYSDRSPQIDAISAKAALGSLSDSMSTLLSRARPDVPVATLKLRLRAASHALLHTLSELLEDLPAPTGGDLQLTREYQWHRVDNLIDFLCGGLATSHDLPVPTKTAGRPRGRTGP